MPVERVNRMSINEPGPTESGFGADDMRALLDTASCGIVVADTESTLIRYVNTTLLDVMGRTGASIVGSTLSALFTADSEETIGVLCDAAATSDGPIAATAHLDLGTGIGLPVSVMARQISMTGGARVLQVTLHSSTERLVRESALIIDRDRAHTAQKDAEDARDRSQSALESSEHALKIAEAERRRSQLLASTLQRTLLPSVLTAPPHTEVAGYYHPASADDVGGDFYDIFPLDERTWGFFLGDVSGKGAGAAAVTSLTRYTLRAAAVFDREPIAVLHNLNTVLHHEFRGDDPRFCTVVYGVLSIDDCQVGVHLASGGHPPALILRSDGRTGYADTRGGQLVGALPEPHFVDASLTLHDGDVLVLYTDGLTEAVVGPGRARFNDNDALDDFAAAAAPTTATTIIENLRQLLDSFGDGLQDDVALLAIGIPHPSSPS
jgi:phosphoserine phosphatase RsbU/P